MLLPGRFGNRAALDPPAAITESTRWRVYITSNNGSNISAIVELQMYATEYGANQCTGGTPTADSEGGSEPATAAFDSNMRPETTFMWNSSNSALPHWLEYEFPGVTEVNGIGIHGRATADVAQMPNDFEVQLFNPNTSDWQLRWAETNITWTGHEFKRFVKPGEEETYTGSPHGAHEFWRVFIIADEAATTTAMAEVEMRATPAGADQCTGGTATASSTNGANAAANAVDNNAATFWQSTSPGEGQWWKYQFASPVEVAELVIQGTASDNGTQPRRFCLQYADNTSGPWTTTIHEADQSGWTAGETRTFTDPNYI